MPAWITPLLCELVSAPRRSWRSSGVTLSRLDSSTASANPTTPPPTITIMSSVFYDHRPVSSVSIWALTDRLESAPSPRTERGARSGERSLGFQPEVPHPHPCVKENPPVLFPQPQSFVRER